MGKLLVEVRWWVVGGRDVQFWVARDVLLESRTSKMRNVICADGSKIGQSLKVDTVKSRRR